MRALEPGSTPINDRQQDFSYVDSNSSGGDGSIGDTIFFDSNDSGLPDPGEGIEGVYSASITQV